MSGEDPGFEKFTVSGLLSLEGLDAAERLLWWALKLLCRGRSGCSPSLQQMSELTGIPRRSLSRAIAAIEQAGGLVVDRSQKHPIYHPRQIGHPRQISTQFWLGSVAKIDDTRAIINTSRATARLESVTATDTDTDSTDRPNSDHGDPEDEESDLPSLRKPTVFPLSLSEPSPPDLTYPYDITWLTRDDWGTLVELDRIPSLKSWVHNLQPGMMIRVFADGSFDPSLADPDAWEPTPAPDA